MDKAFVEQRIDFPWKDKALAKSSAFFRISNNYPYQATNFNMDKSSQTMTLSTISSATPKSPEKSKDACPAPKSTTPAFLGGFIVGMVIVLLVIGSYFAILRWRKKRLNAPTQDIELGEVTGQPKRPRFLGIPLPRQTHSGRQERQNVRQSVGTRLPGRRNDPESSRAGPSDPNSKSLPPTPVTPRSPLKASDFFRKAFPIDHPTRQEEEREKVPVQPGPSRRGVPVRPSRHRESFGASVRVVSPLGSRDGSRHRSEIVSPISSNSSGSSGRSRRYR